MSDEELMRRAIAVARQGIAAGQSRSGPSSPAMARS